MNDRELLFSPKNKQNIEKKNRSFAGLLLLTIDLFGSTARKAAERVRLLLFLNRVPPLRHEYGDPRVRRSRCHEDHGTPYQIGKQKRNRRYRVCLRVSLMHRSFFREQTGNRSAYVTERSRRDRRRGAVLVRRNFENGQKRPAGQNGKEKLYERSVRKRKQTEAFRTENREVSPSVVFFRLVVFTHAKRKQEEGKNLVRAERNANPP